MFLLMGLFHPFFPPHTQTLRSSSHYHSFECVCVCVSVYVCLNGLSQASDPCVTLKQSLLGSSFTLTQHKGVDLRGREE